MIRARLVLSAWTRQDGEALASRGRGELAVERVDDAILRMADRPLAAALRADGGITAAAQADEALATAERLIAETGARNLTPLALVERAAWAAVRGGIGATWRQCATPARKQATSMV